MTDGTIFVECGICHKLPIIPYFIKIRNVVSVIGNIYALQANEHTFKCMKLKSVGDIQLLERIVVPPGLRHYGFNGR